MKIISENGACKLVKEEENSEAKIYSYQFIPEGLNSNITMTTGYSLKGYEVEVTEPEADSEEKVKDVTLSSENNWCFEEDIDDSDAFYYVKEVKVDGKPLEETNYTVSYQNNGGIQQGEIVITNKRDDSYELPETGGPGTNVYTGVGMLLMSCTLLYKYRMRCRKERRVRYWLS